MIIAVTAHRPDKLNNEYELNGPCSQHIRLELETKLNDLKPLKCISGMALGGDTIWAEVVLSKSIPLVAAVPFPGQENRWPLNSQERYHQLLKHPLVTTEIISAKYSAQAMQIRNEWMVNRCNILIAVWNGFKHGGTWNTVEYARKQNKEIIYIDPNGWNRKETIVTKLF